MSNIDPKIKSILDERLAKGEINAADYQSLLKTLAQDVGGTIPLPTQSSDTSLMNPGSLQHAWKNVSNWQCRLHSRYKDNSVIKEQLLWMNDIADYFVTDKFLIVISGHPQTKVGNMLKTAALAGTTGGLAGGLLVSLPALLAGSAYEALMGKNNQFDPAHLTTIYNNGYAIYSKISDLEFNAFTINPGLLTLNYAIVSVIGKFKSAHLSDIDMCLLLNENIDGSSTMKVVSHLRDIGCSITDEPQALKDVYQVNNYLPSEYVDLKNPRQISHNDLTICVKCSHYVSKKGWLDGGGFLSKKPGDQKLITKPSDDRLPCNIQAQASSAWNQYFEIPVSQRSYLYPVNCECFVRK